MIQARANPNKYQFFEEGKFNADSNGGVITVDYAQVIQKNLKINEKLHFCGAFHLIETNSWCFENRNEVKWYLISYHMFRYLLYE